jgi:hypothetical protein
MKRQGHIRATLSVVYLSAVLALFAGAYATITDFEGELYLPQGSSSRTVVARAGESAVAGSLRLALPPELLELPHAAQRRLDAQSLYVTSRLPYALRLKGVEVLREFPPRLLIEGGQGESLRSVEAAPGVVIQAGGVSATVESVRPWMGLLRRPGGRPMAAIETEHGGERRVLLLEEGRWLPLDGGTAARFRWYKTEAAAEAAARASDADDEAASWTVAEAGAPVRMNSFEPGAGAEMDDGRVWQVERVERGGAGPPRLLLRVTGGGAEALVTVTANEPHPEYAVRFDDPGAFEFVITIFAGEEGAAWVRLPGGDALRYAEGEAVTAGGQTLFTLRQVARSAQPLDAPSREVLEAVVAAGGKRYFLREGEARDVGDAALRFRRVPVPPEVRYQLAAYWPEEEREQPFALSIGESARVGSWRFGYAETHPEAGNAAVLHVTYVPFTPLRLAAFVAFAAAAYGITWLRFCPRVVAEEG